MADKLASTVRDALYYAHVDSRCSVDQGYGVVVGVTACLMAERGILFQEAFSVVLDNLPRGYRMECIPVAWWDDAGWFED